MTFFADISSADIAFGLVLVAVLLLLAWNIFLERRLHRLLLGGKAATLDESIGTLSLRADALEAFRTELESYLEHVERRLRRSLQGTSTVRFNPFKGTGSGGNQSFASAFLDEVGDGLVLSTLYARDHVSVFGKPVKKFTSEFELTVEEKEAVKSAREKMR
jgi:hypothetical protein